MKTAHHKPQAPELETEPGATVLSFEAALLVREADRFASAMLSEYQTNSYAQVHAVVALAYAQGARDGYHRAGIDAGTLAPATGAGASSSPATPEPELETPTTQEKT